MQSETEGPVPKKSFQLSLLAADAETDVPRQRNRVAERDSRLPTVDDLLELVVELVPGNGDATIHVLLLAHRSLDCCEHGAEDRVFLPCEIVEREKEHQILLLSDLCLIPLQVRPCRVRSEGLVQQFRNRHVILRRRDDVLVRADQDERRAELVILLGAGRVHHDRVEPETQDLQRMLLRRDPRSNPGKRPRKALLSVWDKLPHVEEQAEDGVPSHVKVMEGHEDGLASIVPAFKKQRVQPLRAARHALDHILQLLCVEVARRCVFDLVSGSFSHEAQRCRRSLRLRF